MPDHRRGAFPADRPVRVSEEPALNRSVLCVRPPSADIRRALRRMFDPAEIIAGLPHLPGVYRMLNAAGRSAVRRQGARPAQARRVVFPEDGGRVAAHAGHGVARSRASRRRSRAPKAKRCSSRTTSSRRSAPRYNILFRDDKSYPYLVVTGHRYPRLGFHRGALDDAPPLLRAVSRTPVPCARASSSCRRCSASAPARTPFSRNRSRPCLLHQIRRCTAPCVGLVADAVYAEDVRSAELFLSGKEDEVIERLAARMAGGVGAHWTTSRPPLCRDQITALRRVREKQFVAGESGARRRRRRVRARVGRHLREPRHDPRRPSPRGQEFLSAQRRRRERRTKCSRRSCAQHYLRHAIPPQIVVGAQLRRGAARRSSCRAGGAQGADQSRTRPARGARGSRWRRRTRSSARSRR